MLPKRKLAEGVYWLGAVDWNRTLFDALIPLPEGTSYNAYLVQGEKVALIDTVDESRAAALKMQLQDVPVIDYVIAQHAEQDHSGMLPWVLAHYPKAELLCSAKAEGMLQSLLGLDPARIRTVADGETLDLGGKTLEFAYTPWVHWPETMVTFLREERLLFSCDFFGSHLATHVLTASEDSRWEAAARLYFAQIMMPYASAIRKNLEKVRALDPATIAPSHGPVHDHPRKVLDYYDKWTSGDVTNRVIIPYVSMHGSTAELVERLEYELTLRGVGAQLFDLSSLRIDQLAGAVVNAATLILASPAVWNGIHPMASFAVELVNGLKPPFRWIGLVGSCGWAPKALSAAEEQFPGLRGATLLPGVAVKGRMTPQTAEEIAQLAETVAGHHREAGLIN